MTLVPRQMSVEFSRLKKTDSIKFHEESKINNEVTETNGLKQLGIPQPKELGLARG